MFEGTKITSVDFTASGITTIRDYVCHNCSALTNVTPFLPPRVSHIEAADFGGCPKLKVPLRFRNDAITAVPDSFTSGSGITEVDFGTCPITTIGSGAFDSCASLTNMTPFLPPTVTKINGNYTFRYCKVPKTLMLTNPQFTHINWGTFQYSLIAGVDFRGSSLTNIADYAFQSSAVSNIVPCLPPTVEYIGQAAFDRAPITNELILSNPKLKSLPANVFYATHLAGVDMTGSGIASIGSSAFRECWASKVVFSEALKSIGYDTFRSLYGIRGIFFRGPPPTQDDRSFILITQMGTAYVLPKGEYADAWKAYIAQAPRLTANLSNAERNAFNKTGMSTPTQKLRMCSTQSDSKYQYLCWWWPKPVSFIMLVK